jgi:hypothetical protein
MTTDMSKAQFAALKRKARAVRARPKRKDRGAGVAVPAGTDTPIDLQPSQNFHQKEDTQFANRVSTASGDAILPPKSRQDPVIHLEPPALWRSQGEMEVLIYCRPLNPRLLLIRTDDGHNGRVAVKPELQLRFGTGKRIWVKPTTKPGFYELVGKYTQWGSRCIS